MGHVHAQRIMHQGKVAGLEGVVQVTIVTQVQVEGMEMITMEAEECILVRGLAERGVDSWTKVIDEKFVQLRFEYIRPLPLARSTLICTDCI